MMEQSQACEAYGHAIFVTCFDNDIISDAPARFCDIFHAAFLSTVNVVAEREERVRSERYIAVLVQPCSLFFRSKSGRFFCEVIFPLAVADNIHPVFADVIIDGVVSVRTSDILFERQVHYLRRLTEEPFVGLAARKSCAVDSGLLSGTDADSLTALGEADGVRLCIFQSNERNDQVDLGVIRNIFILRNDIAEEVAVDGQFISALLEYDSEHLLMLDRIRSVFRIDPDNRVVSLFLCFQKLKRIRIVSRSNNSVGYLSFIICAVERSQVSESEMKSPNDDILSAPLALAYADARGESSPRSSTQYIFASVSVRGLPTAAPAGDTCLNDVAAGSP